MLNHQDLYVLSVQQSGIDTYSAEGSGVTRVGKLRAGTNFRKRNILKHQLGKNENDHSYLLTNN